MVSNGRRVAVSCGENERQQRGLSRLSPHLRQCRLRCDVINEQLIVSSPYKAVSSGFLDKIMMGGNVCLVLELVVLLVARVEPTHLAQPSFVLKSRVVGRIQNFAVHGAFDCGDIGFGGVSGG